MITMEEFRIGKYKIDPILFKKGFAKGCGPYKCETTCCSSGVFLDPMDRDAILKDKDGVKQFMDDTQSKDDTRWFDNKREIDSDFPSGYAVGTEVINDKCAFLREDGRCSVQLLSDEKYNDPWKIKPYFCVAFPICLDNNVVTFDEYQQDNTSCCSIISDSGTSLVESCKAELIYILGEDGYKELLEMQMKFERDSYEANNDEL